MVQQQQWRLEHEDSHYSACIFRYMREYAVLYREYFRFVSLDDKYKIKIGHPGCPVAAAAERGCQVLVHSAFQVGDHDFTNNPVVTAISCNRPNIKLLVKPKMKLISLAKPCQRRS